MATMASLWKLAVIPPPPRPLKKMIWEVVAAEEAVRGYEQEMENHRLNSEKGKKFKEVQDKVSEMIRNRFVFNGVNDGIVLRRLAAEAKDLSNSLEDDIRHTITHAIWIGSVKYLASLKKELFDVYKIKIDNLEPHEFFALVS